MAVAAYENLKGYSMLFNGLAQGKSYRKPLDFDMKSGASDNFPPGKPLH